MTLVYCPTFYEVNNHIAVTLLGGQRALLLQLAHPLVAAGVRDHSRFLSDPWGRLTRTLDFMQALLFGTDKERERALRWFHSIHAAVRGRLGEELPPFSCQTPYTASFPSLLLWVWATLVETAPFVYERVVAPLNPENKEEFYQDSKKWGVLLGISERRFPPNWKALESYVERNLSRFPISPTTQGLATYVLFPPGVPYILSLPLALITLELLPPSLRPKYGLEQKAWQKAYACLFLSLLPSLWPWVPQRLRSVEILLRQVERFVFLREKWQRRT